LPLRKDKKHLYYYDKLVAGAEVENLMEAFANDEIISDSKTVYYGGTPLHYQREKLTQVNRRIFKRSRNKYRRKSNACIYF